MTKPSLSLGMLAMAAVYVAAGPILSLISPGSVGAVLPSTLAGFLAALFGAYIARRGFYAPALGVWFAHWAVVVYWLYRVATGTPEANIGGVVEYNGAAILASGLAVLAGVALGQFLAQKLKPASMAPT